MSLFNLQLKMTATSHQWTKVIFIFLLSMGLFACDGEQGDDLDNFIKNSAKDMRPKIKPLPEVKP